MKEWLRRRGSFAKAVAWIAGGTAGSQLLGLVALPLLTRLYDPAEFKLLAGYASVIGVLSVIACLRFEQAIPLPAEDEEGTRLLALSLVCLAATTAATLIVVAIVSHMAVAEHWEAVIGPLWLVPIGIFLSGLYGAGQYWAMRRKAFAKIAQTRVTQMLGGLSVQLGAGFAGAPAIGLLAGHAVSGGLGAVSLIRPTLASLRALALSDRFFSYMRETYATYIEYPKYSVLDGLSVNAAAQVPTLLIAALVAGPEAGFLFIATRIVGAPINLVAGAIGQAFLGSAPERERQGRLGAFTAHIVRRLLLMAAVPALVLMVVAIPGTAWVFGEKWARVGEIILWMLPWYGLRLISSPISTVMNIAGRQRQSVVMKVVALVVRLGSVIAAYYLFPNRMVETLAVVSTATYLYFTHVFLKAAGSSWPDVFGLRKVQR